MRMNSIVAKIYALRRLFIGVLLFAALAAAYIFSERHFHSRRHILSQDVWSWRIPGSTLIDETCDNNSENCYRIYDLRVRGSADRFLVFKERPYGSETVVALQTPKGGGPDTQDTRTWAVNHSARATEHGAGVVAAAFLTSLSISAKDYGKQVLEIGLGGGGFDMRLSFFKPEVNITVVELDPLMVSVAYKWFGVKDSDHHHVVIQDGLDFLKVATKTGLEYDVIYLDACGNDESLYCPHEIFHTTTAVRMIRKVLRRTGTLIVNVATMEIGSAPCKKVMLTLTSHFNTCVELRHRIPINMIIACSPIPVANLTRHLQLLNNKLKEVASSLQFGSLKGMSVNEPNMECLFREGSG